MSAIDPHAVPIDEAARERFERAWLSGTPRPIEEFLPADDRPEYPGTLEELVLIDLEFAWKTWAQDQDVLSDRKPSGEARPAAVEEYLHRFPRLRETAIVERLLREEQRVRRACGDDVDEPRVESFFSSIGMSLDDSVMSAEASKRVGSQETTIPGVPLEEFLRQLRECDLLPAEEVNELSQGLPHSGGQTLTSIDLAQELVRRKKLTAHQATALLQGLGASLVLGNYVILDKLGQGGMGMVFQAEHRRMRRRVALKVLAPGLVKSPDAVKRFQREVQAVARLDHPNIVAAHDADEAKGVHFLVMQFIEGTDLASYVKSHGPLQVDKAISCILQAAQGLEYAHRHGVIHRDIKPANLLLGRDGIVKILDMGLARVSDGEVATQNTELTNTGSIMGTVDFMPPEQALDTKQADHRSDIYSLGCSLYYLLTGRPVYDGDTIMKKILAHRERPVPALAMTRTDVSGALDHVFQKMVAKRPEDRYQTATDVVAALRSCLNGTVSPPSLGVVTTEESRLGEFLQQLRLAEPGRAEIVAALPGAPTFEGQTLNAAGVDQDTATSYRALRQRGTRPSGGQRRVSIVVGTMTALLLAVAAIISISRDVQRRPQVGNSPQRSTTRPAATISKKSNDVAAATTEFALQFDGGLAFSELGEHVQIPSLKFAGDHPATIEMWCTFADDSAGSFLAIGGKLSFEHIRDRRVTLKADVLKSQFVHPSLDRVTSNRPVHMAGTYDGRSIRLFVDGHAQSGDVLHIVNGANSPAAQVPIVFSPSNIGSRLGSSSPSSQAVHFIAHALRVSKSVRYHREFEPPRRLPADADTLALYRFNEGEGSVLNDSSGNKHDGKIVGAKWVAVNGTPADLERLAGERVFSRGGAVTIAVNKAEKVVKSAAELPPLFLRVVTVELTDATRWTDDDLRELRHLKELKRLYLSRTQVSDAGLSVLSDMEQLQFLDVSSTKVTAEGLESIVRCRNLGGLRMGGIPMTQAGLKRLEELPKLVSLELYGCRVTDKMVPQIAELRQLKRLNLHNALIADLAVRDLRSLTELESLSLANTRITDACVDDLAALKKLRDLNLSSTGISPGAIARLQQALPDVKITVDTDPTKAEFELPPGQP